MSGKKPFAGTSTSSSGNSHSEISGVGMRAEQLVGNSKWLVNDISRRISIATTFIPRLRYALAGTGSAGYLANHLIDLSGDENSANAMMEDIRQKLYRQLGEEEQLFSEK